MNSCSARPPRPWPVLCLGNSVRVFDEATFPDGAQIDDEGAAVCCVEEEDAAGGVGGPARPHDYFRVGAQAPSADCDQL